MDKIWLKNYQKGVAKEVDPHVYASLNALLDESLQKNGPRTAYISMGTHWSFHDLEQHSRHLATYLQSLNLAKGTRVAVMLPNILQ